MEDDFFMLEPELVGDWVCWMLLNALLHLGCPTTVIGIIAGGDKAIRNAVEFAEDDLSLGWKDLKSFNITENDFVIGIAASGSTPYVIGALKSCKKYDVSPELLTEIIQINELSDINNADDQLTRKRKIEKILNTYIDNLDEV